MNIKKSGKKDSCIYIFINIVYQQIIY